LVVAAICRSRDFISKFRSIISRDAFIHDHHRFIVDAVLNFYDENRESPSTEILADLIRRSKYRDKTGAIDVVQSFEEPENLDYIIKRMMNWSKWTAIDRILMTHNGEDANAFSEKISKAARTGDDLLFNHTILGENDTNVSEKNPCIPTPWVWLNDELDGGPEIGDLCIILTVVSGGKTTSLVNIARAAIKEGKFVVYFTFEDGEKKIRRRLIQSICRVGRQDLAHDKDLYVKRTKKFLLKYGGRCEIKDLMSRRSSVEDAAAFIRNVQEITGRKVDLIISDYMDRYRSSSRSNEPRHGLREIAEDCKWMARDLNVVHWTARQVNKSRVGKDIISYEHAGESWGTMESPDIVIGLGQTLEDEAIGRMKLFTSKMRDNKDHQQHVLVADFERQLIEDLEE